ncbi:anaphase promoting complex subunit cdc16, partial [Borealophlyctis nickersoniae]
MPQPGANKPSKSTSDRGPPAKRARQQGTAPKSLITTRTSAQKTANSGGSNADQGGDGREEAAAISAHKENMARTLRLWRDDAKKSQEFGAAAFWGDKVLTLTGNSEDAYELATLYYLEAQYARAEHLLTGFHKVGVDPDGSPWIAYLHAQCLEKLKRRDDALKKLDALQKVLDRRLEKRKPTTLVGGVKMEAMVHFLRGTIVSQLGKDQEAAENLQKALRVDARCYQAIEMLANTHKLTNAEELEFVNSLDFSVCGDMAECTKLLYLSLMKKYNQASELPNTLAKLESEYHLRGNADIGMSKAELYYLQCKYEQCYAETQMIMLKDPHNLKCLPTHILCLVELDRKTDLFYLSHELVDRHPEKAITWYACATYYLQIRQLDEARRFYQKAIGIDASFSQAYVGLGHTHADNDDDSAILWYTKALKSFKGSHLPPMYLGMQHMRSNSFDLAERYLKLSMDICNTDPLVANELGVLAYDKGCFESAVEYLGRALELAGEKASPSSRWESTRCNLGHSYRMLGEYQQAKQIFEDVLERNPSYATAYAGLAFCYQVTDDIEGAIHNYHQALHYNADDSVSADLLYKAIELEGNTPPDLELILGPEYHSDFGPPFGESIISREEPDGSFSSDYTYDHSSMDVEESSELMASPAANERWGPGVGLGHMGPRNGTLDLPGLGS